MQTASRWVTASLLIAGVTDAGAQRAATRLLRQPTVSATSVVFGCSGDLWVVSREGGEAQRQPGPVRDRGREGRAHGLTWYPGADGAQTPGD